MNKLFILLLISTLAACKQHANQIETDISTITTTNTNFVRSAVMTPEHDTSLHHFVENFRLPALNNLPFTFRAPKKYLSALYNPEKNHRYYQLKYLGDTVEATYFANDTFVLLKEVAKYEQVTTFPCFEYNCPVISCDSFFNPTKRNRYHLLDPISRQEYFGVNHGDYYLIESFSYGEDYSYNLKYTFHFCFDVDREETVLLCIDREGKLLDKKSIFPCNDTMNYFLADLDYESLVQIFSVKKTNQERTGYVKVEKKQSQRLFLDEKGTIHDWTQGTLSLSSVAKYFLESDTSKIIQCYGGYNPSISFVPLPLNLENQLFRQTKILGDQNFELKHCNPLICTPRSYFYQLWNTTASYIAFTVLLEDDVGKAIYLFVTDYKFNYLSHFLIALYEETAPRTAHIVDKNTLIIEINVGKLIEDTVRILSNGRITSTWQQQPADVNIAALKKAFPKRDAQSFNVVSDSSEVVCWKNTNEMPQELAVKLSEALGFQPDQQWNSYNYSFNEASNGNKYMIFSSPGGYGCHFNLYLINSTNRVTPFMLSLSESWGDETEWSYSYGKFENDTIYHSTGVGGDEMRADSVILDYLLSSNGKIYLLSSEKFEKKIPAGF